MDVKEALNAVFGWLSAQNVAITTYHAQALPDSRFRVEFQQVLPEPRQRTFDVVPMDIPDCWDVVEIGG